MGISQEQALERARHRPLRTCVNAKLGHLVGIPPGLRGFRDPIFNIMPGTVNVAVEVGTFQGWFAYRLATYLDERAKIFCVDPFYDCEGNPDKERYDGTYNLKCWKRNVRKWFGKKVFLKRGYSHDEARLWGFGVPIDFIFFDGDHRFESVMLDLEGWVPKVRVGGLVAGHDIDGKWGPQTKKALEQYCSKNDISEVHVGKVYSFTGKKVTNCWWFYKQTESK